jgi:hypothetical protein
LDIIKPDTVVIIDKKRQFPPYTRGRHIEFSKFRFYLLLHGLFIGVVLLYQSLWIFSDTTMAACGTYWGPYKERRNIEPGTLMYAYRVNDNVYTESTTRNGTPISQEFIRVRYLTFWPSVSRLDSYEGNWLGFQIAWLIFFVITSMIFFIPNPTMPKNSYIYFTGKKPWIHMIVK